MEQRFTRDVLSKLKQKKRRKIWRRILSVLMCIVVFWTTYAMILPAITKETPTFCGIKEHIHEDQCFQLTDVLLCSLSADPEHTHTEGCYARKLICIQSEHKHSLACYSDPNADVETAENWKATLPAQLVGVWAEDVLAVAKSQLGYAESTKNYIISETGEQKGYTRYGAWYGTPYDDWDAMFVAFCLYYAGVEGIPLVANSSGWVKALTDKGLYRAPSEYIPKPGDLIFFDWENDGQADHVGLVESLVDTNVYTIEGDIGNRVNKKAYELHDDCIAGYGALIKPKPPQTDDPTYIGPEDTDAWAVLEDPRDSGRETPQTQRPGEFETSAASPSNSAAANPYSLRVSDSAFQNAPRATSPLDLTPYINSVKMYDRDGNPIDSGSVVTEGDLIEFKIEYTVTGQQLGVMNGEEVSVISDTLTYKLPEVFQMIQSGSGNIINSFGQVVGSYVIDNASGIITLNFNEDYVEQNAKGIQIHGYISFFSLVTKITDSDSEDQEFEFTDEITLGIIIEEEKEVKGDLTIEKNKVSVNGEEITYEVIVKSTEGTYGPITITDKMSKGLTFKEGIEVRTGRGTQVNNVSFNPSADRSSFTMNLPELAPGESYVISYKCTADIDLLDSDMTVRNTASVTGKDNQGNDLEDETTVDHTFDVLKKTGVLNDDGTITWSITINQAKADISGWTLEDIISTNNGSSSYTGTVTITNSNGSQRNVRLPYTFPQGSTDVYVVSYTTTHNYGDGDTIYNKAILKDNNTDITVVTGVGIGSPFTKTGEAGELLKDANGTNLLPITWTVTIDTTKGPIPAGEVIYDKMNGSHHTADMYMTYDQLMATIETIERALVAAGSSVQYVAAEAFVAGYSTGSSYNRDKLENDPACKTLLYERFSIMLGKEIPQGKQITFSYEAYGIFPNNLVEETEFKNRIGLENMYEIEASVRFTSGIVKATKYAMKPYNPNANIGSQDWALNWSPDSPARYSYSDLHDAYLAWAIELSVSPGYTNSSDILIYEDLPEGVTVRGLDLPFFNHVPTSRLMLRDMVPGNTYDWTFMVYSSEEYLYGATNGNNGTEVTITVKFTEEGDLEIRIPGEVFTALGQFVQLYNERYGMTYPDAYGYLYIYTQIDEDYKWTPTAEGSYVYVDSFKNSFTMKSEDGDVLDIGSQTQIITKDESSGIIRKEAATDNNNIITYSVVLNAYKKDLIENSGILAIHDELSYPSTDTQPLRLRLVPGSVKLYEIKVHSDGSYTKLNELTFNYSYNEVATVNSGTTTWVHTIDLTVPDGKSLLLEYSYKASGDKNVTHDVLNVCSIRGIGEGSLDGEHKVEIEVKEATAQADTKGVMIYKVDANSDGIFLENARFNIYIWNKEQNAYIIVHHPDNGGTDFTTDANGMIVLDNTTMDESQFAYNTAYYIVEVESPEGYYLGPEPYYFYIVNDNTVAYPSCIPDDFVGHALTSGDIIYRDNVSELTEITVEKYWRDYNGNAITVFADQIPNVTLELWQTLKGDPSSEKLYGTYTMTPDANGNWSLTITDLPKATKNNDGTKGTDYLYYIKEVGVGGYALESSENNNGINSGTIKLVNRKQEGYTLPETGGIGTQLYTTAGLLLILTSTAFLLYNHKKRGGRNYNSA